jgi:endogenous inhibitor of DNA gyrase (YacG/DUF329 family)
MIHYEDFLDDSNEYECPQCGGSCTFREITADGMVGVACDDYSCTGSFGDAGFAHRVDDRQSEERIEYEVPEEFVVGEPKPVTLSCPECGSDVTNTIPHDDGPGYWDVKIECPECETSAWQ